MNEFMSTEGEWHWQPRSELLRRKTFDTMENCIDREIEKKDLQAWNFIVDADDDYITST